MEFKNYTPGEAIEGTELLEDGRHECVILKAEDGFDNDGTARMRIVLQPLNRPERFAWPVLRITDSARGVRFAAAIADALGIDRSTGLGLYPEDLQGQTVTVTTRQWKDDQSGRVSVSVDGIRPGPMPRKFERPDATPAKAATPKPRTAAAKVAAARGEQAGGEDDVPF